MSDNSEFIAVRGGLPYGQYPLMHEANLKAGGERQQDAMLKLLQCAATGGADKDALLALALNVNGRSEHQVPSSEVERLVDAVRATIPREIPKAAGRPILRWLTGRELVSSAPPTTEFILRPYIPAGVKVELHGRVKEGKTTFALYMARCAVRGESCLGYEPCPPTKVLYCSEQPEASLRGQVAAIGLGDSDDFFSLSIGEVLNMSWEDRVECIHAKTVACGARLVFLDTASPWMKIGGDDENSAGVVQERLALLDRLTRDNVTVAVLRHTRKGRGDLSDAGRGSSAFSGEVDVILDLSRAKGSGDNERLLQYRGRFHEIPDKLPIQLVTITPTHGVSERRQVFEPIAGVGSASAFEKNAEKVTTKLIPGRWYMVEEVSEMTGLPDTTARRTLKQMVDKGLLANGPQAGERNTAVTYGLPEDTSHQPQTLGVGTLATMACSSTTN